MKTRTLTLLTAVFAILFLFSCATTMPTLPSATTVVKKAVKKAFLEPTLEILEINMEKIERDLKVTGTAIYHPADVGGKAFSEYAWDVKVEFYDVGGNKLPFSLKSLEYGVNNKESSVVSNEAFPFTGETSVDYMGQDTFDKAVSCKIVYIKAY